MIALGKYWPNSVRTVKVNQADQYLNLGLCVNCSEVRK